jgi:hypothetical protein
MARARPMCPRDPWGLLAPVRLRILVRPLDRSALAVPLGQAGHQQVQAGLQDRDRLHPGQWDPAGREGLQSPQDRSDPPLRLDLSDPSALVSHRRRLRLE